MAANKDDGRKRIAENRKARFEYRIEDTYEAGIQLTGTEVKSLRSGQANIAFLIKPITLDQLKDVSLSGEVMPQKSTDFYPKLLSGLAIYALD